MIEQPDEPQETMKEANQDYDPRADDEQTPQTHKATEEVGRAMFDGDETKTCRECGETTKANNWRQTGPTHEQARGNAAIQMIVLMTCPECGAHQ